VARQPWQLAHPGPATASVHCNAAAKARAATERPLPGGPVNSQAWVIAPAGPAASTRVATAGSCPTRPAHTLILAPPGPADSPEPAGPAD
jgi:hypothetical protein